MISKILTKSTCSPLIPKPVLLALCMPSLPTSFYKVLYLFIRSTFIRSCIFNVSSTFIRSCIFNVLIHQLLPFCFSTQFPLSFLKFLWYYSLQLQYYQPSFHSPISEKKQSRLHLHFIPQLVVIRLHNSKMKLHFKINRVLISNHFLIPHFLGTPSPQPFLKVLFPFILRQFLVSTTFVVYWSYSFASSSSFFHPTVQLLTLSSTTFFHFKSLPKLLCLISQLRFLMFSLLARKLLLKI